MQVFRFGRTGSGDGQPPRVDVTAPAPGATVPPGPVEITGTATDPDGVGAVQVSVLDRTTGESWHTPTSSWRRSGSPATAALAGPLTSQVFRWVLPTVRSGHRYVVRVQAYDADGAVSSAPLPAAEFMVGR